MHRKSYLIKNGLALYVHFGTEPNLENFLKEFDSEEKVDELFAMGDLIQLGENIEKSVFFCRDQNVDMEACIPVKLEEIYTGDSNKYIFEAGAWRKE